MHVASTHEELDRHLAAWRQAGDLIAPKTIALVPTMGSLHEGHLALVHRAGELADRVVVSIFVNPTQFNEARDFDTYPRDFERDRRLLEEAGCDLLFAPTEDIIYPPGFSTFIEVDGVSEGLEGEFRPGHFRGVATVVTRLFRLVGPDLAVFGEKDAQQLAVVRRLSEDLDLGVEIVAHPTLREADGLAMSSRNRRLSTDERRAALVFHQALTRAINLISAGERDADEVRTLMRDTIEEEPLAKFEYAEVVDPDTFRPLERIEGRVLLPVAGWLGDTRLIDNLTVTPGAVGAARSVRLPEEVLA